MPLFGQLLLSLIGAELDFFRRAAFCCLRKSDSRRVALISSTAIISQHKTRCDYENLKKEEAKISNTIGSRGLAAADHAPESHPP